jgi:hypothetical protein
LSYVQFHGEQHPSLLAAAVYKKAGAAYSRPWRNCRDAFPREHQKNRAQVRFVHFVCFAATGLRYR